MTERKIVPINDGAVADEGDLWQPTRHVAIGPSLVERVADFISDARFLVGLAGGSYFTLAAAWVWSWFL